jgi:ArsR family metal-binding transcriptional regulator
MKKGLTLTLEDAELVELYRILIDKDAEGALEFLQSHLISAVRDLLNQCWDKRDTIQPVTAMRRAPRPLDVWTLLPQANCKCCGEATCMAFAFGLLQQERRLEECPVVANDGAFAGRRAQLAALV